MDTSKTPASRCPPEYPGGYLYDSNQATQHDSTLTHGYVLEHGSGQVLHSVQLDPMVMGLCGMIAAMTPHTVGTQQSYALQLQLQLLLLLLFCHEIILSTQVPLGRVVNNEKTRGFPFCTICQSLVADVPAACWTVQALTCQALFYHCFGQHKVRPFALCPLLFLLKHRCPSYRKVNLRT